MQVDQTATGDVIKRLRRVEGQIRGVIGMLEEAVPLARLSRLDGPIVRSDRVVVPYGASFSGHTVGLAPAPIRRVRQPCQSLPSPDATSTSTTKAS